MKKHQWDVIFGSCLRCGRTLENVIDGLAREECAAGENVVAITHVLFRRQCASLGLHE